MSMDKNDGMRLLLFQKFNDFIGVISTIRQDVFLLNVFGLQDLISRHTIIDVACGYFKAQRVAQAVDKRMDLAG
nr:hypothetical protein [Paenibacillus sp. sptzw28]